MMVMGCAEGWVRPAVSADPPPLEYQLKAAFLYQFVKFVEWPPTAFLTSRDKVIIGLLGESPMKAALAAIEGKEAKGRQVRVEVYKTLDDLHYCHVLFISPSMDDRLPAILKRLRGWSSLTVSNMDGFARRGGMINFVTVENKIRFEVNVKAAERAHVRISSQLLRLASLVHGQE